MICKDSKGNECEIEIEHASDPCDSFAASGYYTDGPSHDCGGKLCDKVHDEELDWITENYADKICESHFEWMCGRAESMAEGDR